MTRETDPAGAELPVPAPQHHTRTPAGRRSSATPLAPPGGQPDPGVTDSQLAVLLRTTQWACDEAAYHCAGGMLTPQSREELAGTLEALAAIVRASAPEHTTQTPADRRLSAPALLLPAPDDRPDPHPGSTNGPGLRSAP